MALASTVDSDDPLDLHDVYRAQAACGYTRDLTLRSHQVQHITGRLRGIHAVAAVLVMGESLDATLGAYLRSGLIEAIHAMSLDGIGEIDSINSHAGKAQGATA